MRKLLNKLLIKFGLLLTKAPALLAAHELQTSELFPAELTERVKVGAAENTPDNDLFRIFAADTNVHKWHHYFDIYTRYLQRFRDRPITMTVCEPIASITRSSSVRFPETASTRAR